MPSGWNCHISLNEDGRNEYGKEESNAQLPRGIKNMKHHIATVDDVPLLVPLFSGMLSVDLHVGMTCQCVESYAWDIVPVLKSYPFDIRMHLWYHWCVRE